MILVLFIKDNIVFILFRVNCIIVYNIFRIFVDEWLKKNYVDCILVFVNSIYKMLSVLRIVFILCVIIFNYNNKV